MWNFLPIPNAIIHRFIEMVDSSRGVMDEMNDFTALSFFSSLGALLLSSLLLSSILAPTSISNEYVAGSTTYKAEALGMSNLWVTFHAICCWPPKLVFRM